MRVLDSYEHWLVANLRPSHAGTSPVATTLKGPTLLSPRGKLSGVQLLGCGLKADTSPTNPPEIVCGLTFL